MQQQTLDIGVLDALKQAGYNVLPLGKFDPRRPVRTCFDIAARKENIF